MIMMKQQIRAVSRRRDAAAAKESSIVVLREALDNSTKRLYTLRASRAESSTLVRLFTVVNGRILDLTRQASRASGWRFDERAWGARVSHHGVDPAALFAIDTIGAVYGSTDYIALGFSLEAL